ncbi:MAG: hypothetical protein HQ486_01295 [Acidimicrobiaceae bacterium]|nr:hypothetical protein [Acidimicrobiaceae bacterium]
MSRPIDINSESLRPDLSDPAVLSAEIDRLRKDPKFMNTVKLLVEKDREILDRLADC